MRRNALTLPAALALAACLTGCGVTNPYAASPAKQVAPRPDDRTTARTASDADPAPERGGTIPKSARRAQNTLAPRTPQASPQTALDRYAMAYINWTAETVTQVQRRLAAISVGSARAQALQAAASYSRDTTLLRSHVANSGTVIAIARGQGTVAGDWVVVTRETTTGQGDYQGLPAELHITCAELTHTKTGWVVSTWSPQI
jgi:predicted small lipoprotein YifL